MNSLDDLLGDFRFFHDTLSRFLERNRLFQNGNEDLQAFVGVSGGADSLCLLYTLSRFPEIRKTLTILHFNHQTDPERNGMEEAFVRDQAGSLGLPVMTGYRKQAPSGLSEDLLRRERYQFFDRCLDQSSRPDFMVKKRIDVPDLRPELFCHLLCQIRKGLYSHGRENLPDQGGQFIPDTIPEVTAVLVAGILEIGKVALLKGRPDLGGGQ